MQINSKLYTKWYDRIIHINLSLINLLFLYHVILICVFLKWKVESELEKNGILVRPLGRGGGVLLTQVPPRPLGKKLLHFAYRRPLLGRLKVMLHVTIRNDDF